VVSDKDSPYRVLDADTLPAYLADLEEVRTLLDGPPAAWRVREVGDGNLNMVFIVEGRAGSVCVKQALPYVRVAGPGWPMSPERAYFEQHTSAASLLMSAPRCPKSITMTASCSASSWSGSRLTSSCARA